MGGSSGLGFLGIFAAGRWHDGCGRYYSPATRLYLEVNYSSLGTRPSEGISTCLNAFGQVQGPGG